MSNADTTTAERIVKELGESWELPVDALKEASEHRDQVAPKLIELLDGAADMVLDEAEGQTILLGTGLLAEWRDTRAYEPLVRFLKDNPLEADECFGEAATEVLPKYLVALAADQNLELLLDVARSTQAEAFHRIAALDAWCYLAWSRGTDQETLRKRLLEFYDGLNPKAETFVAACWAELVVILGLDAMEAWIDAVIPQQAGHEPAALTRDDLQDIERVRNEQGVEAAFHSSDIGPFSDTIATFSQWHGFTPEGAAERKRHYEALLKEVEEMGLDEMDFDDAGLDEALEEPEYDVDEPASTTPVQNPYRNVGRNDRCPCGSGKKYKKCCGA
jgi:hypothetical protein